MPLSLAARVALWVVWATCAAVLLGLVLQATAWRAGLPQALARQDQDAAVLLAQAVSPAAPDPAAMRQRLQALADERAWQRLELWSADGELLLRQTRPDEPRLAPAWFARYWTAGVEAAVAPVGAEGLAARATLRLVAARAGFADAAWSAAVSTTPGLLALAALAGGVSLLLVRRWLRPVQVAAAQARALEQGRFQQSPMPALPELRHLTQSMNAMVRRTQEVFAAQAEQVQELQRQAQIDTVTGLPLRQHFIGQLQAAQAAPGGPGLALILVRIQGLEGLNERLGHESTDRLLATAAGLLVAYVDQVPGTFAGRLNGSDYALCLPVAGLAQETAQSLHAALVAAPALRAGGAQFVVGAVDDLESLSAGAALAAADAALAQAETDGGLAVQHAGASSADPAGARAWREQIASALTEGRVRLSERPVRARDGSVVHLECALQVQLGREPVFEDAGRWLALARRSRLLPQVDFAALDLALAASARDGQRRVVPVSLTALQAPGFIADAAQRLETLPPAARCLRVEVAVPVSHQEMASLSLAAARWGSCGVAIGVVHAGALAQQLMQLGDFGVCHVKLEARHLRGLSSDAAVRAYAQSLVSLIHGLGATAIASGIDSGPERDAAWALGFDAATGAALDSAS